MPLVKIDPQIPRYIAAAKNVDDLSERLRIVLKQFTLQELYLIGAEAGISGATLYQYRRPSRQGAVMSLKVLKGLIGYFAPDCDVTGIMLHEPLVPPLPELVMRKINLPDPFTPPDGWRPHPTAAPHPVHGRWYYKDQTVLTEKQLREMVAQPVAAE